jgi:hypothetical protein
MQNDVLLNPIRSIFGSSIVFSTVAFLGGCAATQTALEHGHLEVSTQQSDTVFLDPVLRAQKTIYVSVKNTSDRRIDITAKLKSSFQQQGYHVVSQVDSAHYLLQANILKVGKMSVAASTSALGAGFGSALAGGVVGASLGALTQERNAVIGGGIAGGLVGMAADALVRDVNYTMITDVQISERVDSHTKVQEEHSASLTQGSATHVRQMVARKSPFQRYRTRIVSNADKVNLAFKDAIPALEDGLVKTLVGIF